MSNDVGQLLLVGVPGTELEAETAAMLRRVQPGGFILFGRNIQSPEQVRKLIDDLRDLSSVEPVITIDQEGGRVSRLRLIGEEPPNAQQLRDRGNPELVRRHGELTAKLLRLFGFNLDLCPVLDLSFDDEADNSLRGRCYGKTVEQVIALERPDVSGGGRRKRSTVLQPRWLPLPRRRCRYSACRYRLRSSTSRSTPVRRTSGGTSPRSPTEPPRTTRAGAPTSAPPLPPRGETMP